MAKDKKAPQVDDSPEAAATLAALGTPQASKDVVALIVEDVVDASRPRYDNGSSSAQRMLTFSVRCGTTTRRCYEAAPLKAEAMTGDAILIKRSATAVGDLLQLKPTTAEVFCGARPNVPQVNGGLPAGGRDELVQPVSDGVRRASASFIVSGRPAVVDAKSATRAPSSMGRASKRCASIRSAIRATPSALEKSGALTGSNTSRNPSSMNLDLEPKRATFGASS